MAIKAPLVTGQHGVARDNRTHIELRHDAEQKADEPAAEKQEPIEDAAEPEPEPEAPEAE